MLSIRTSPAPPLLTPLLSLSTTAPSIVSSWSRSASALSAKVSEPSIVQPVIAFSSEARG